MGLSLSRSIINVLLSQEKVDPGNLFRVQIEEVVSALVSRTGRHLQRYDKGCRQAVGCIPYRYKTERSEGGDTAEEIEFLVISSQKGGKGMMFPKGSWEIDETKEHAALHETREEAGVVGTLENCRIIWSKWMYRSKSRGSCHDGCMFSLHVSEQLDLRPEMNLKKRR